MKKGLTIACLSGLLFLGSCEELGFNITPSQEGEGWFSKNAILLDVRDDAQTVFNARTRAEETEDFKILFFKNGGQAPEKVYKYSEMPDVVVLPVGKYTVTATKGSDVEAAWEAPYYLGESEAFYIMKDSISSEINPIICRMQNVKVSVEFDASLSANMSDDSYVEVKVGDNDGLHFTKEKEGAAGHFRHTDGVSLVATFHGTVEGEPTVETKSFESVKKGHHYKIKFKLHSQNDDHTGGTSADVTVDASVTVRDLEWNVDITPDEPMDDSERPKEDPEDPQPPTPPTPGNGPSIVAQAPINLDGVNVVVDEMECVLNMSTNDEGGFTVFNCKIESPTLDVTEVGLSNPLDLINPGNIEGGLIGLGLLEEGEKVKGAKSKVFDLTSFMPLLAALGVPDGSDYVDHKFILTVGDANGEVTKTLILRIQ